MTIVSEISNDLSRVAIKIEEYSEYLEKYGPGCFDIENKLLEDVAKNHSKNLYNFSKRFHDLKSMEDIVKVRIDEIESAHWRKYTEKYSRALSTRDIQAYIQGESDYVAMYEVLLEVVHVKKQYEAVVETLKNMSWMINNITKIRIEQMEMVML